MHSQEKAPAQLDRAQGLLLLAACLLGALSTIGAALPYPILPPLFVGPQAGPLAGFLGLPPKWLFGAALAINPLGLLLGAALLGPLSDRYGRRRTLFVTAVVAALGHALTALALLAGSYPGFMLARFATGLAEGNAPVARAMLADRMDRALRVRAFAWFNSALYLGWLAGPMIAGLTLGLGLAAPFLLAATALLLSGLLTLRVLPVEAGLPIGRAVLQEARERHALRLLADPSLHRVFWLQLCFTLGLTSFYEYYPVWLVEMLGLGASGIAWVTAGLCAVLAISSGLAGRLEARAVLSRSALAAGLAALCFLLVATAGARIGVIAIVLAGLPVGFYNALIQAEVSRRYGDQHGQGAVMGLVSTTFCLANIVAALLGSILAVIDTRVILGCGGVSSALAAAGLWRWARRERHQPAQPRLATETRA